MQKAIDTSYVIPPVDKNLILEELKSATFLKKTNYANREIYVTNAHRSPSIMREIGRLREISFGASGGGSGTECDIDQYDLAPEPHCYQQLFVWDTTDQEIIGGYRFIVGRDIMRQESGELFSATADLFEFTDEFVER